MPVAHQDHGFDITRKIKELFGGIADKRLYKLQKKLIWDLDAAGFKTIDLGLYLRLGGWSHTGGTYL